MNPRDRVIELLIASPDVDYVETLADRHLLVTFYDKTSLLIAVEGAA